MYRRLVSPLLMALAIAASPALAADPNLARNLAATCASCHGTNGHAIAGAGMPALAGQPREAIIQRFREFRAGTRPATVMHQIAKGYDDAQLSLVADWFAAQPR